MFGKYNFETEVCKATKNSHMYKVTQWVERMPRTNFASIDNFIPAKIASKMIGIDYPFKYLV